MVFVGVCRYVDQGKGILQPHVLIDELDNVTGENEAKQHLTPFSEILKNTQVTFSLFSCSPFVMIFCQ